MLAVGRIKQRLHGSRWSPIRSAVIICRSSTDANNDEPPEASLSVPSATGSGTTAPSTRVAVVQIIEDSWERVSQLVPGAALELCEEELKSATALLVLATVRRAADDNPVSRATVERMFREADVNGDGQLSFLEWFQWLGSEGDDRASGERSGYDNSSGSDDDPMIAALSLVLSSAVCTLKTAVSISQDASVLSAAFVAGGTMAGVLDAEVVRTMLSRLTPRTRCAQYCPYAHSHTTPQHLDTSTPL